VKSQPGAVACDIKDVVAESMSQDRDGAFSSHALHRLAEMGSCGWSDRREVMTTTEEIIVSGENFIERRVFVYPQQGDVANLQHAAYSDGYSRGWLHGVLLALGAVGVIVLCIWLAAQ
jgi:hypothetical protein